MEQTYYVPFLTKKTVCELLVDKFCYQQIGDLRVFKKDTALITMFFKLEAAKFYLGKEYDKEKPYESYDEYSKVGVFDELQNFADYKEFYSLLQTTIEDAKEYETDLVGRLSQTLNTVVDMVKMASEEQSNN